MSDSNPADPNTVTVTDPPQSNGANENPFLSKAREDAVKPKEPSWLDYIVTGKKVRPTLTVLYGPPGVGKTTFAAGAPNPIFIPTERGVDQVGATRFPRPESFEQFRAMCSTVAREGKQFQTLVIDTADGLEALIWDEVCKDKKVKSIEELKWGDGYTAAKGKWRALLNSLVLLSERKNVIILCHSHIKTMNDPALPDPYDCHRLKLHDKSAEVLRECCDNILFANFERTLIKDNIKDGKGSAVHSGDRIIKTVSGTGYEGKNRFNLPDQIPLIWDSLADGIRDFYEV